MRIVGKASGAAILFVVAVLEVSCGGWSVDIPLVWDGAEFSLGGEDGRE